MAECLVNLFSRVEFGHILVIAGTSSPSCKNFKITLKDENEISLVIFVNLRMMEFVMNSYVGEQWGEALKVNAEGKINAGDFFKFYIFVSDNNYHISLNQNHLCSYKKPQNFSIKSVKVSGDLQKITQIDHRTVYPLPWPPIQEDLATVAFSSDVPYQFTPGSVIVLKMSVSGARGGSFFIRFNDRATKKQLLHLNPRFFERVIVVNSMNDNLEWLADEKRFNFFPFELDKEFIMAIAITSSSFKAAVNGKQLLNYDFKSSQQQALRPYNGHHRIFDKLTGFKIFGLQGMRVNVSYVDHLLTKDDCEMYEALSSQTFTA